MAMLDVDAPAVFRAIGLLRAMHDGDAQRWSAVLAADNEPAGDASPYKTFCAMTALADRAIEGIWGLTGETRDDVLTSFTTAFVKLLADLENRGDDQ